ncbi:hypothetical protein A9255_00735 [Xenorhabdus hominickii]|uniref:Uncharacterized protein n=1 Tax=Xenorhabdus hominickii TaxID=351679 RepID=A0A2G0Q700_XENHO|nr:hypothetical protein A9255_00735 [Xenorhabdus hominickii]PHM54992.1 hypothetical protein Xhom_02962 [Xenorhabdus hominickii]
MTCDYHFSQPLLNIKNMFNSTAPVIMGHLSMLEDNRFHSTSDNLKGLFEDRCLLDTSIGSFKSLSSNYQTTLQIFAYGKESREPGNQGTKNIITFTTIWVVWKALEGVPNLVKEILIQPLKNYITICFLQ